MLCPQNMSLGPRRTESIVWHVLKEKKGLMLLLMMMDDDEGCWMMVMVMLRRGIGSGFADQTASSTQYGMLCTPFRRLADRTKLPASGGLGQSV